MTSTHLTVNRPGLSWASIPFGGCAAMVEQDVGSQRWVGILTGGTFYPLVLVKHVAARPELVAAVEAVRDELLAALDEVSQPDEPAAPLATFHMDYVFDEDRQRDAAVRQLRNAEETLHGLIARIDRLGLELLPVAQEPGDAADQMYMALSGITDALFDLSKLAGRGARRYG